MFCNAIYVRTVVLARPGVSVTDPLFWLFVFFSVLGECCCVFRMLVVSLESEIIILMILPFPCLFLFVSLRFC
jgi:hypothetical protein